MEGLPITEYLIDVGSDMDDKSSGRGPTDDQCFLLYFIMGTYFGPDVKGETQKSVFQRRAEGLPPYTPDDLASSCMKKVEVERIYYYILRKADQSAVLKLAFLRKFFHGNLSTSTRTPTLPFPQFDDLFPPHLHPHSIFKGQYEAINNIVFISDPKTLYIGPEYLERFKRLTKLEDVCLDKAAARCHTTVDGKVLYNIDVQEIEYHKSSSWPEEEMAANGDPYSDTPHIRNILGGSTLISGCVTNNGAPTLCGSSDRLSSGMKASALAELKSDMIFIPTPPSREEWANILNATKSGCGLTGSATMGHIGPNIGNIDIGECEDSYLFRVSLPGVKRDEREFSCEVEDDGKVSIRGVTVTGEKTVSRFEQVFEMQSQKLCPPGHFSISFKLPGPVDPHQFSGSFGTDGILEGIVMKARRKGKR
uniref:increased DNA methylation 2-like n=1 Tax=Erigeron canadensis TaxID=72917 RepID=UPI001CB972C7|nr:increased DNA methylation 2-like [Erigeron canadensis]